MNTCLRKRNRTFLVASAVSLLTLAVTAAAADSHPEPKALVALLESDAPGAEKAIACKQLAVFGDQDAVPALATLLPDAHLSSWARIALEAIPGNEADEALQQSLSEVEGRLLIGVINSIGVRGDANAVEKLAELMEDEDADVASAAAVALGRIGNDQARQVLLQSLAQGRSGVRSAIAEGCILCAEQLIATGNSTKAAAIYDQVRNADVSRARILEATRGAILARGPDGIALLVEQLNASEEDLFEIGLSTARELPGEEATMALAEQIENTTPQRGALLVQALADRGDDQAQPILLKSAQQGPKPVRIAAIRMLQHQGDRSCVEALLEIAIEDDSELAHAARDALAELPDSRVDAEIVSRVSDAEGNTLPLLIEIIGRRRIDASPALLKAVNHSNAEVRRAALTALGQTINLENLDVLIARVVEPANDDEATVAQRALQAACVRMSDREACAKQLADAMNEASTDASASILETLGAMGGESALHVLVDAAQGDDRQLQDVASRLLGEWMTLDAAPELLAIAKTPENSYRTRALRGYIRLARQFDMPSDQRAEMCRQALKVAERDDEKKLVLQVLQRYPSQQTLMVALQAAGDQAILGEAEKTAQRIQEKLKDQ